MDTYNEYILNDCTITCQCNSWGTFDSSLDIHHRDYCSRAVAPPISSWAAYVWCVLPYHISSSVNLINRSLFTLSHHINTRNPPTHTPLDLYTCLWKVEILLSAASTRLVEKLVPAPLERFTWVNWTLFFMSASLSCSRWSNSTHQTHPALTVVAVVFTQHGWICPCFSHIPFLHLLPTLYTADFVHVYSIDLLFSL